MLIVSRKVGESVVIETTKGAIEITFTEWRGAKIRLGFIADDSIKIWRKEIYDAKQKESE